MGYIYAVILLLLASLVSAEQAKPELCHLPADKGPCKGHFVRWFHNTLTSKCEQFIYGGCEGNKNNFLTEKECKTTCQVVIRTEQVKPEFCHLPPDTGPGKGHFPRWFHNTLTSKCEQFIYGGVDGNKNRFLTQKECNAICEVVVHTVDQKKPEFCHLPSKIGPCRGHLVRWFHNSKTSQCEKFVYGGCEANANNFETEKECKTKCQVPVDQPEEHAKPEFCHLPPETGPGKGHFPRWFHNTLTSKCEQFIYGGVDGNKNRFLTEKECNAICEVVVHTDTCQLPPERGPCEAYMTRWFHDPDVSQCKTFIYGGCDGNENNFISKEQCEKRCLKLQ